MSDPLIGIPLIMLVVYVLYEATYYTINKLKKDAHQKDVEFIQLVEDNIACHYPNSRVSVISYNRRKGTAQLLVRFTSLKNTKPYETTLHVVNNPKKGKHPDEF